jgi:hypothetical protein
MPLEHYDSEVDKDLQRQVGAEFYSEWARIWKKAVVGHLKQHPPDNPVKRKAQK